MLIFHSYVNVYQRVTPITMVCGTYNYGLWYHIMVFLVYGLFMVLITLWYLLVYGIHGVYKPIYNWWGHHSPTRASLGEVCQQPTRQSFEISREHFSQKAQLEAVTLEMEIALKKLWRISMFDGI